MPGPSLGWSTVSVFVSSRALCLLAASAVQTGPSPGSPAGCPHPDPGQHHAGPVALHQTQQAAGQPREGVHQLQPILPPGGPGPPHSLPVCPELQPAQPGPAVPRQRPAPCSRPSPAGVRQPWVNRSLLASIAVWSLPCRNGLGSLRPGPRWVRGRCLWAVPRAARGLWGRSAEDLAAPMPVALQRAPLPMGVTEAFTCLTPSDGDLVLPILQAGSHPLAG